MPNLPNDFHNAKELLFQKYCQDLSPSITNEIILQQRQITKEKQPHGYKMLLSDHELSMIAFLLKIHNPNNQKQKLFTSDHPYKILEIGTFTGVTTLFFALYAPLHSHIFSIDIDQVTQNLLKDRLIYLSEDHSQNQNIKKLKDRISLYAGPALKKLENFLDENMTFDFIFIDADKKNQKNYLELSLRLLEPGGICIVDNTFFNGHVLPYWDQSDSMIALKEPKASGRDVHEANVWLNQYAQQNTCHFIQVPIRDGMCLIYK